MAKKNARIKLRAKQNGKCCYCGCTMTPPQMPKKGRAPLSTAETIEHLRRIIEGGTDRHDNLALACFRCNTERGGMDWLTYTSYRRGELWDNAA